MSIYIDGFDAATGMGKYWESTCHHACPYPDGSNDAVVWHLGYADGVAEFELWPDLIAAINWVPPVIEQGIVTTNAKECDASADSE